jgi:tetratricopeptide (TPR) repeat protein
MSQRRSRTHRSFLFKAAIVVAPLLLAASPAIAASRQAQERAARKACLNGDYAKGVAILSELFIDTKDSTYIFNQARCYEQGRRYEDAIARFDEFLQTNPEKLSAEDKAAAEKHLSTCKERLAGERGTSPTPPATQLSPPAAAPSLAPTPNPEPSPEPSTPVVVEAVPQQGPAPGRWSGLATAGIITGSVGVLAVAGGVVLNLKANSMVDNMETSVGAYSTAKANDQKTYKTLAWVGYGAGAACVVAGAILIGVGIKSGAGSSTSVALVPAVGQSQVGAMLTGAF